MAEISLLEIFQPFNDFPVDVQRLIFEHAFYSSPTAVQLALVSRKIHRWIEPLIYRSILTSRVAESRKSLDFYESHVKFLIIDEIRENGFIEDLISVCHNNLIGLAFWPITHNRQMWASLLLTIPFPCLRRLSISSGSFPSGPECIFRAPMFQNLSHLEIRFTMSRSTLTGQVSGVHDPSQSRKRLSWEGLQTLEYLNHLHIDATLALKKDDHDKLRTVISDILSHLPPRLVYVSVCLPSYILNNTAQLHNHEHQFYDDLISGRIDPRIVVCYVPARDRSFQEILLRANFSEYLLPRRLGDRMFDAGSTGDFSKEVENITRRRNRELVGDNGGTKYPCR